MENVDSRGGQERFPDKDPRLNPVPLDQGQTSQQLLMMGEQRGVEPYKLVEVQLTGGAPWGFTLKGGREHGEPLIITKIEEGSKAAAVEKLLAGDEIVSINDVGLSGFRQEAICLVKGSHKILKLVVKRKNDLACRPHSWHATKFTENQPESTTSRLSSTNVCTSWHSRCHASSSSHDLSSSWDQSNLHRTSDQFSSAGSMDSWEHPPQGYQYGQISSAKSNSSIDHLGNPSKRDSAYGSFSTSSSTPDHTLSSVDVPSAENMLYKMSHWETPKQGDGKTASFPNDNGGLEEKSACFPSPPQYENINKSPRQEDHSDMKCVGSGRSNFGPVWYVPERKKSPSPPPPPPPLRSDSFAATKGHERTHAPLYSEAIQSTQHFEVLHRPQARNDWSTECVEQQKRSVRVIEKTSDGKQSSNPTYRFDRGIDYSLPSAGDRVNNNVGNANRLHSSLSSTDVRFAQSIYGHHRHHHQRQYSDESTFFNNAKNFVFLKDQWHLSPHAGIQEKAADKHNLQSNLFVTPSATMTASDVSSEEKMDSTGVGRYYCVAMKQPAQGNSRPVQLKDECWNSGIGARAQENLSAAMMTQSPTYYLPQQPEPFLDTCEKSSHHAGNKGEDIRTTMTKDSKQFSYPEKAGQTKNFENHNSYNEQEYAQERVPMPNNKTAPKDFKWGQEEKHKISPQKTPMLHSLAQEGKNQPDKGAETVINRHPAFDAHLSKNARRSDRFATTLRNEIQMRRAKMQKSRSTAALAESTETQEFTENWKTDPSENVNPSSENTFTNEYKDNLKEIQARVLRATSFQRRDLEPCSTDYFQDRKTNSYNSSLLALVSEDESGFPGAMQPTKQSSPASNHYISRIGGRKRFTAEQKLKSYSEPEKMNEVGVSDDDYHPRHRPTTSEEALGSFADRWKFFEETSKPAYQKSSLTHKPYGRPEGQPGNRRRNSHEVETEGPWCIRRMRAASFGIENTLDAYNRSKDSAISTGQKTESGQPQRLETFAEYQASWKEQRKPSETRSSGRYHSADNILDSGHEQLEKPQYIHERSRSSPSTDFHKQEISTEVRRQTEHSREAEEHNSSPARSEERSCSSRPVGVGYPEGHPGGPAAQPDYGAGNKWKTSTRPSHTGQTSLFPQGSRSRSGTLPSDYRYSQENVSEKSKDYSILPLTVSELQITNENHFCQSQAKGEESLQAELGHLNRKHGPVPERPPQPCRNTKHRRQDSSSASLAASSESLLTGASWPVQSGPPVSASVVTGHFSPSYTVKVSGKLASAELPEAPQMVSKENVCQHLEEKTDLKSEPVLCSAYHYLQKPGMETSRSPSPQFAPQKLTDKPPVAVLDENPTRIERVMDNNTMVKMVPIKIVHSESHAEKESRQNLASTMEPPALPSGLEKDQIKTLSTSEQSYSRFCAYTRQGVESEPEKKIRLPSLQPTEVPGTNLKDSDVCTHAVSYVRAKEKTVDDWKSEELAREIVGKDKSLADILNPNGKIRTTMDLMEGIFPKDEHLLEEAQQRRKLLVKIPSPKAAEDKKQEQIMPLAIPLTTNSTYYSTSAPKAELLIKMKDMQQQQLQQQSEEDSEDELDHDLSEKKQELIDSISRKLHVLREARETLLEDIQANSLLGDEVEAIVKEVCKPNEFDKFRMFIGDLDKVVNLLLSLSGRLARVENALNNLDESASPEERRVLVEKQKLLTQQHEDAKELKENLDRRERIVFDILASYLSDESLADYEHFVKMKSALIIEQRELEDKIKLGEEQLKCLTDSLQPERPK